MKGGPGGEEQCIAGKKQEPAPAGLLPGEVYLHAGGSPQAYSFIKEWGVTAMDCVNGPYEGTLFWRDKTRKANAGLEHSVMASGEKITQLCKDARAAAQG